MRGFQSLKGSEKSGGCAAGQTNNSSAQEETKPIF